MTERNNENRLGGPPPGQPESFPPMPNQQSSDLQFSTPTEIVELPSRGEFYPEGHPLHNKETVEIKYMTAKEEDILASANLIKKGIVFDRLLQSIMVTPVNPDDLLLGDRSALLVAARITGYGSEYGTLTTCPSCSTKSKYSFDLTQVTSDHGSSEYYASLYPVNKTDRGTFLITLSDIDAIVEVKFLTGRDEKRLASMTTAKKKNNLPETSVTDNLKACIVSVNDNAERGYVNSFVDNLPALHSRKLRKIYKNIAPQASVTSVFSCANCGHEQELEVPINFDFFWPDS
jgi:hypothetical protein